MPITQQNREQSGTKETGFKLLKEERKEHPGTIGNNKAKAAYFRFLNRVPGVQITPGAPNLSKIRTSGGVSVAWKPTFRAIIQAGYVRLIYVN
ncbi:hypothetical protein [Candidatus Manganitrophus noduliformans]|uniref:Uncharacterized protein n=1 Tax=Candidatus Manganitrophus noduliformans TaxID=2606439 RepID=A0A7X6IBB8_9BACT|nr:hypothetical protein [Candidatus Manganitrophus noduliformans]NKE71244.1 hypothetical protein [Candidatus Manganitrophus noduliformans]